MLQILRLAWKEEVVLVDNETVPGFHPELFALAIISLWPKKLHPAIVLTGDMYQQREGVTGWLAKQLVRLADRCITLYAIRTTKEIDLFPNLWGVDPKKLRLCPYYYLPEQEDLEDFPASSDNLIFAGGNTYREYPPLVEAAKSFPETEFIFATSLIKDADKLPGHIKAGPISHQEYMHCLRTARINVVAMQRGVTRAVGEQTFIKSMWLRKPTVVTDESGARDHIEDGKTGFIVDGSVEQYVEIIGWLLAEKNQTDIQKISEAAHKAAAPYTLENHVSRLLEIIDEAIEIKSKM